MKLEFHPAVRQDFIQARDYYQTKGGAHLADRFEREFQACCQREILKKAMSILGEEPSSGMR
jgi:plasmid stabilization system protein ParE